MKKVDRIPLPPAPALPDGVAVQTELLAPMASKPVGSTKAGLSAEDRRRQKFLERLEREHLPRPHTEYMFAAPARQWRLDFAWLKYKVALESDGGAFMPKARHTSGSGYEADIEKRNEATLRGWMVLNRLSHHLDTDETVQMLRRAFQTATRV